MIYILLNIVPILAATALGGAVLAVLWRDRVRASLLPVGALALFWIASILAGALILAPVDAGPWTVALGSAVVIWCGFVLPALVLTLRARGHGWGAALYDATAWLAVMLVQAAAMRAIGVVGLPD